MLVGFLDHGVLETLALIGAVAKNSELTDAEKVQRICALLTDNQVTQSLDPEQLAELKATLVTELSEEDYYLILSSKSVRMQNRVGPILKAVKFVTEPSAKDLHRAMENFRLKDGAIDKTAPVDFLTPDDRTAVSRDAIKSGTLNLENSYKYRPLDAHPIDRERWQRDKPLLIERADLQAFLDPPQVLADLDAALYRQYLTTNAHILDGKNPHIVLGPLQLIHRLHVVSKAVFRHLSPELGTVGTGMPGMYSAHTRALLVSLLISEKESQ